MTTTDGVATKKKHRVFMWAFLALQALFIVWIIGGASTGAGQPTDCGTLSAETCNAAADVGTGIGVALIVMLWFGVNLFIGLAYGIFKLARRP